MAKYAIQDLLLFVQHQLVGLQAIPPGDGAHWSLSKFLKCHGALPVHVPKPGQDLWRTPGPENICNNCVNSELDS